MCLFNKTCSKTKPVFSPNIWSGLLITKASGVVAEQWPLRALCACVQSLL